MSSRAGEQGWHGRRAAFLLQLVRAKNHSAVQRAEIARAIVVPQTCVCRSSRVAISEHYPADSGVRLQLYVEISRRAVEASVAQCATS